MVQSAGRNVMMDDQRDGGRIIIEMHRQRATKFSNPDKKHLSKEEMKKRTYHKEKPQPSDQQHAAELASPLPPKAVLPIALPPKLGTPKRRFDLQDALFYNRPPTSSRRILSLDESLGVTLSASRHRKVKLYPADFTDNTQLYSILDSDDERLSRMELREPHSNGECVPMQDWQTTFHPSCNGMHEIGIEQLGEDNGNDVHLFGTKGYWRNAWRLDLLSGAHTFDTRDTIVLKTLKYVTIQSLQEQVLVCTPLSWVLIFSLFHVITSHTDLNTTLKMLTLSMTELMPWPWNG